MGRCGRAPAGRERLRAAGRPAAVGGAAARTATSTPSAPCSRRRRAPRSQRGHTGVARVPRHACAPSRSPPTRSPSAGVRGDAVRLLTAHRAKGLEWPLVVVAHVQEEAWPDLRRRGRRCCAPTGSARDGPACRPTTTRELLAEERRLFYVACTRARAAARRHRRRVARRRGRAALPVPRRARRSTRPQLPRRRPAARGRCRWPGWWPSCGVRSPTRPAASRSGSAAARGWRGWPRSTGRRAAARAGRRPGHLVGHPRADASATSRCAGPTSRWRSRPARSTERRAVPGQVVPRARGRRASGPRPVARASATSSTPSPTGSYARRPRAAPTSRRADAAGRRVWGQLPSAPRGRPPGSASRSAPRSHRFLPGTAPTPAT